MSKSRRQRLPSAQERKPSGLKEVSTFATAPICDKAELVQSRMQRGLEKCTSIWDFSPASFIGEFIFSPAERRAGEGGRGGEGRKELSYLLSFLI